MKELFMCLLLNLQNHGDITAANLYEGGNFSNLTLKGQDGVYTVTISKEEKKENEK